MMMYRRLHCCTTVMNCEWILRSGVTCAVHHQQRRAAGGSAGGGAEPPGLPWDTSTPQMGLPPIGSEVYQRIGNAIVAAAQQMDAGLAAFQDCLRARSQLEAIVQGCGYSINVHLFGGIVVHGFVEVGTDVDFVGVADCEPSFEEASQIVMWLAREMRRHGLRATAFPRARIPVVKVDRANFSLPGRPLHRLATSAIFQFSRALSPVEQDSMSKKLRNTWGAVNVTWSASQTNANVIFARTDELVAAISRIKKHEGVEVRLRAPLDPRSGPELWRFPFDLCLSSTGLRNSHLFGEYLAMYPYGRHLLLLLKRWGRSSGIVNSIDGLLASYAITVMLLHYLVRAGVVPPLQPNRITHEPHLLPCEPQYRALQGPSGDLSTLGYLYAHFFIYYSSYFDFTDDVVCTTTPSLKKSKLKWIHPSNEPLPVKPPFYHFAVKDPYGVENIARNLDARSARYVRDANLLGGKLLAEKLSATVDPAEVLSELSSRAPKPPRDCDLGVRTGGAAAAGVSSISSVGGGSVGSVDDQERWAAKRMLFQARFQGRKEELARFGQRSITSRKNAQAAENITKNVVNWIHGGQKGGGAASPPSSPPPSPPAQL